VCERERAVDCTGLVIGPTPALMDAAVPLANAASHPIATYPTTPSVSSKYDRKFYAVIKLLKCIYA
jgi:hypothetical protein